MGVRSEKYWPHFTAGRQSHVFCDRKVVSEVDRMKVVYQMETHLLQPDQKGKTLSISVAIGSPFQADLHWVNR